MKVLQRYISKEFIKFLILCQFIFLSMFLVIDFVQKIDNFIEAEVSKGVIFSYFLYKTPFIIFQMIPVATLISIIILFCLLKKNNEIMAMKACGLNLHKLSQSIIIISLLISIITFLFSELIVPYTSSRSNEIWDIEVEKQDPTRFYGSDQIWYKSSNAIYWIRHFDSERNIMQNPTFYFFDKDFRLVKRIDGRAGIWQNGIWRIEEGVVQKEEGNGDYELTKFKELFLEIPETPDTFVRKIKKPEDMSFQQLKNYSEKVRNEGYDNTRYLVDMNIKLAFPFISLVLVLLGIPIALKLKIGGIPLAVSIGVGLCFLYMITFSFSRSLGLSGVLPPILSAWTANLIFILFGIYLMMGIER
ncbi:LPS export ABC transporter permease LptG [Thermodesulfobacteriota bacterium]